MKPRRLEGSGYVDPSSLPRGPGGRALCRYCGEEVPPGRRTFCSGATATFARGRGDYLVPGRGCVHEHCVRSDPGYARRCVWARDLGRCAICHVVSPRTAGWQADHVLPVSEGGGSCGLENLRTLCTPCHAQETARLAARRAEARRLARNR